MNINVYSFYQMNIHLHVPLLKYKIDSQNKYFAKSCVIVEQCWSTVTSVVFVTV